MSREWPIQTAVFVIAEFSSESLWIKVNIQIEANLDGEMWGRDSFRYAGRVVKHLHLYRNVRGNCVAPAPGYYR